MTRPAKKRHERFLVEQAAHLLGKAWHIGLEDRENPDFLVTEGDHHFGLEVCEVFTGEQDESGSSMKKLESKKQKSIDELRRQYEAATAVTLTVKFVGITDAKDLATVVSALLAEDLAGKALGYHCVIDQNSGLRLHVTKALRADWYSVDDRVAWLTSVRCHASSMPLKRNHKNLRNTHGLPVPTSACWSWRIEFSTAGNSHRVKYRHWIRWIRRGFELCTSFPLPNP